MTSSARTARAARVANFWRKECAASAMAALTVERRALDYTYLEITRYRAPGAFGQIDWVRAVQALLRWLS